MSIVDFPLKEKNKAAWDQYKASQEKEDDCCVAIKDTSDKDIAMSLTEEDRVNAQKREFYDKLIKANPQIKRARAKDIRARARDVSIAREAILGLIVDPPPFEKEHAEKRKDNERGILNIVIAMGIGIIIGIFFSLYGMFQAMAERGLV